MSANLDLVTTFLGEFGAGSLDKALGMMTDDAKWAIVQTVRGVTMTKAELGQRLGMMRKAFRDDKLALTPISHIEDGNRLSVEVESYAKTILDTVYENRYCILFTIEGGKISDVREYNDSLHVTQVLLPAVAALS